MDLNRQYVSEINQFLKSLPWCDFEIFEMSGGRLTIQGSISPSYPFDIRIFFDEVFHIQCNSYWKTDTSKDVISVAVDEEARTLNVKYGVEVGNVVFKLSAEDLATSFYVVAKSVSYILKE